MVCSGLVRVKKQRDRLNNNRGHGQTDQDENGLVRPAVSAPLFLVHLCLHRVNS